MGKRHFYGYNDFNERGNMIIATRPLRGHRMTWIPDPPCQHTSANVQGRYAHSYKQFTVGHFMQPKDFPRKTIDHYWYF